MDTLFKVLLKLPLLGASFPDRSSPHSLFFCLRSHVLSVSQNLSDAVSFTQQLKCTRLSRNPEASLVFSSLQSLWPWSRPYVSHRILKRDPRDLWLLLKVEASKFPSDVGSGPWIRTCLLVLHPCSNFQSLVQFPANPLNDTWFPSTSLETVVVSSLSSVPSVGRGTVSVKVAPGNDMPSFAIPSVSLLSQLPPATHCVRAVLALHTQLWGRFSHPRVGLQVKFTLMAAPSPSFVGNSVSVNVVRKYLWNKTNV